MRPSRSFLPYAFVLALTCATATSAALAQARKPITIEGLLQMKKAGFDEQTIVKAIEVNGTAVDTSVQGLIVLKEAGFGDAVMRAILGAGTTEREPVGRPVAPGAIPDDVGAFALAGGPLKPLPVEIVAVKSRGMLKAAFTAGIAKAVINGFVSGATSAFKLPPPFEIILRTPDGVTPGEYQVFMLDAKKNRREFVAGKAGITGTSLGGVSRNTIETKFERIDRNVYKAVFANLKRGEYGILAPGLALTNLTAAGKMYTFSVVEQ